MKRRAQELLERMVGETARFRPGQWEAIEAVVRHRERALIVQRTGWGKSLVYFMATRLLRDEGAGPTLLISPLLALMRNQIEMARRIGINALTINCGNRSEWDAVEDQLARNECDLLLISPERLSNDRFLTRTLPTVAGRIGLFVVDEVHCISDWGHDFRPDYRRIKRIVDRLPASVPVLGTTATANDRVLDDVQEQFGSRLRVMRGPLTRSSLRLQNIVSPDQSARLAWLASHVPKLPGSGIIYCLTVADTDRVARWLVSNGINAAAYHAGSEGRLDREGLERALIENRHKALVATVALGMGFAKPDLGFVVHFQRPGSVIAYYQQVGRAGRALDKAYGILLSGREDDDIQDYFIDTAFPSPDTMRRILDALDECEGLPMNGILERINTTYGMAEKALKLLELDGAVGIDAGRRKVYFRTPNPWNPNIERMEKITALRRAERAQMQAYVRTSGCLMEFLARSLDDPAAGPCGQCANCRGEGFSDEVPSDLVLQAVKFLRGDHFPIEPRRRWPSGVFPPEVKAAIPPEIRLQPGRTLCSYGDAGWGKLVRTGKYLDNWFSDELVGAAAELITERWRPDPAPQWLTAIPSNRHPNLVAKFAERLSRKLAIPFIPALKRTGSAPEQKEMANSTMQARNVLGTLEIAGDIPSTPVLLIDDIVDSRWTLTMAGYLLLLNGSGAVHPFTLAKATSRKA